MTFTWYSILQVLFLADLFNFFQFSWNSHSRRGTNTVKLPLSCTSKALCYWTSYKMLISSVFLLHSTLMIGFTFADIGASWKIICGFQAPVTISVLWEWISWSHLKIFGLCGEESRQTIPNCRQLCCAVSQKILCLHYSITVPFLPHGACQTVEAHVNCGSNVCVTHMAHCAAHSVFAPGLCPHHPYHPGRLPFPSVRLP